MADELAYSRRQLATAVNLSALLGWTGIALPLSFEIGVGILPWAAAIGLPISFFCCWLIAAPIFRRIMRKEISCFRAAFWGGAIALFMALVSIVAGRFRGWMKSLDPNYSSQLGGGDYVREIDGILTAYGWLMLAKSTAVFVALGVIVALAVRCWIGKPDTVTAKTDAN
ncbi:hypothetical protein N6L27_00895 [Leisingera sp. SS27]|uniref:hypothetical protein n=1 Tax=Leisingera sp. SS27 TaxID=2979462 RepID=UPI00232D2341|nr:hypothetical protein [Leisingera sp. SS27]MDC0656551.1 hypothetical protein [Leisingera sp. SS27]